MPRKYSRHGMKRSRVYRIWCAMIQRCKNPKLPHYGRYGGRGIAVCERWANSFEAFLEDMGMPPSGTHQIDREDNDRGYEPGNCRWVTPTEQARNKGSNHALEHDGRRLTVAEWAEETKIHVQTILHRLRAGWSVERTLTESPRVGTSITYKGATKTLAEWTHVTGISANTLNYRVKCGWEPERALTTTDNRLSTRKG